MSQASEIVGLFALDVARAVQTGLEHRDDWGIQVGVVVPADLADLGPDRVWLFPVAAPGSTADAEPSAMVQLDEAVSSLVIRLFGDLRALEGPQPVALRMQVDATDGATDLDFAYEDPGVDPLDPDDVSAWLDELFGES
ncbi:MAG: hypothetical protein FWC46_04195 [Actinomycetia bacterium]|nr:hypothetical protein [Actinomycetes bacterium]